MSNVSDLFIVFVIEFVLKIGDDFNNIVLLLMLGKKSCVSAMETRFKAENGLYNNVVSAMGASAPPKNQ